MAAEDRTTAEEHREPAVAPVRFSRHRIFALVAATVSGGALNVAASAVAAPPLWAAALISIGIVALSLVAEKLVARWRETGMQQPMERLLSAVRDQWVGEANQHRIIDQRRLTLRLRPAEQTRTLFTEQLPTGEGAELANVWLGTNRESARWLVLLGDKGAGKSELLIAMMVDLLSRRKPDDQIPVLIPIASWTALAADDLVSSPDGVLVDLYTWLEQWLISSYAFLAERTKDGPTAAKTLLDSDKIAFVIDGFDELPPRARREALRLLVNDAHRCRRMMLTSRAEEYEQAAGRPLVANSDAVLRPLLPFPGIGIQIAPLEQSQVVEYLYRGAADATRWGPLAERLAHDLAVQSVFDTPLMTMLVDTLYNRDEDGQVPRADIPPIGQLAAMEPADMHQLLLTEFLPARYGNAVSAANARRWLHKLVLPAATESQPAQPIQDIAWWRLGSPTLPPGRARAAILAVGGVAAFLWTAVSAGLLNGWVFHDAATGLTDALRVGLGAVICYTVLLALTRNAHAAIVAALGAYIGGSISAVYELTLITGLAAGFSWRPLNLVRGGMWRAFIVGSVAVLAPAPVRLAEHHDLLPLEPSLTEGFAAGFADGWVSGWDQDVNGALATMVVVTVITALGMRFTPTAVPITPSGWASHIPGWRWSARRMSVTVGLLAGTLVWLVNSWADAERPQLSHAYLLAPAEGLAVGLAVWVAATVITVRSVPATRASWRSWAAAAGVGLATAVLSGVGNTAKGDVHDGWARGIADGVTAAIIIWSVLKYQEGRWTAAAVPGSAHRPLTPMLALRILLTAFATGAVVGALYGISASLGPAVTYGAAVAALVLSRPWWPVWRTDAVRAAAEKGPLPPFAVGLAGLVIVGLIAGMAYGVIYGLLAGLASKVAAEIAYRSSPSLGRRTSKVGIVGGVLLGATVAAAASVTGIDPRWLPLIGVSAALAASLAFGTQGVAKPNTVMSPRRLLARDRGVFLTSALIVAAAVGVAVGVRTSARGEGVATAMIAALTTSSTYGITAGLTVAAAQSRTVVYLFELALLAMRGLLPWRLMAFLDEAYNKGVLRQYGPVYRLRHQELATHLSTRSAS